VVTDGRKASPIIDSELVLYWTPLLSVKTGVTLGLSDGGDWTAEEQAGVRVLNETWKFVRLLVLLERPISHFRLELTNALISNDIDSHKVKDFPHYEIVKAGLQQKSDYWADLALNWFIDEPHESEEIIELLKVTSLSTWASQKLRHRIKKVLGNIATK
jgi:hypothetical protein